MGNAIFHRLPLQEPGPCTAQNRKAQITNDVQTIHAFEENNACDKLDFTAIYEHEL
jgi:hypothetical protein